jgi:hypothetical protein
VAGGSWEHLKLIEKFLIAGGGPGSPWQVAEGGLEQLGVGRIGIFFANATVQLGAVPKRTRITRRPNTTKFYWDLTRYGEN